MGRPARDDADAVRRKRSEPLGRDFGLAPRLLGPAPSSPISNRRARQAAEPAIDPAKEGRAGILRLIDALVFGAFALWPKARYIEKRNQKC